MPLRIGSIDFESHLVQPGILHPPIVCGSRSDVKPGSARLFLAKDAEAEAEEILRDYDLIIGANLAFDMGLIVAYFERLIPLVFKAYDEDRVYDVLIAQALDAIAKGHLFKDPRTGQPLKHPDGKRARYNLENVTDLVLGRSNAKENDFYRKRYAILERVPFELWPPKAIQYPIDDAWNTIEVGLVQLFGASYGHAFGEDGHCAYCHEFCNYRDAPDGIPVSETPCRRTPIEHPGKLLNLHNMPLQVRAAFALHLSSMWGLRTDRERTLALEAKVEADHQRALDTFVKYGFIRGADVKGKKPGSEDESAVKKAVALAYGVSGSCPVCNGTGKVLGEPTKTGKRNPVICRVKELYYFPGENGAPDAISELGTAKGWFGCDGTGLDLRSAPGLPRAEKGGVKTDRDTLSESGDEVLEDYASVSESDKLRTTYVPYLKTGFEIPINPRANVLLENGRSSYEGIWQTFPRSGGVRECFVARPEKALCSTDVSAFELCTLGQVCLWTIGRSKIAETINETGDPGSLHTMLAARMVGATFEDMKRRVKAKDKEAVNMRQAAKPGNFGFPGGMSALRFVLTNRKRNAGFTDNPHGPAISPSGKPGYNGIRFCILIGGAEACGIEKVIEWKGNSCPPVCKKCLLAAEDLRAVWFETWPEMKPYFNYIGRVADIGEIVQFVSERTRGGVGFTDAANGFFSALAADGFKHAMWKVARECYAVPDSPLYGTRPVLYTHDDILTEMPLETAHLAGERQAQAMIEAIREYVPDVTIVVEPALMLRLSKDAATVRDEKTGKLLVWEPEVKK